MPDKKAKELNENDLNNITGGVECSPKTFEIGSIGTNRINVNKVNNSFDLFAFLKKLFGIKQGNAMDQNTLEDIDPQDPKYVKRNLM